MKQITESEIKNFIDTHPGFKQKKNANGKDSKLRTYLVKKYSPNERFGRFLIGLLKTIVSCGIWLKSKTVRDQLFFAKKAVVQVIFDKKNLAVNNAKTVAKIISKDNEDNSDKKITPAKVEYLLKINFPSVSTKNLEMPIVDIENNVIRWPYVQLGCCYLKNLEEILERIPGDKEVQLMMPTSMNSSIKFEKNIALLIERKIKVSIQFDKGFLEKGLKSISIYYLLEMLETKDLESFWHVLTPSSRDEILSELVSNLIISAAARELLNKLPDRDLKQLALSTLEKDPKKFVLIGLFLSSREDLPLEILLKNNHPNSFDILSQMIDDAILMERRDSFNGQSNPQTPDELKSKQGKLVQLAFNLLSETQLNELVLRKVENKNSKAETLHKLLKFAKKGTSVEKFLKWELLESCIAERYFYTKKEFLKNLLMDLSNNDWKNLVERLSLKKPEIFGEFILSMGRDQYQFIIEHLFNLENENLLNLFDINNFPKEFLKKVLQKLKVSGREAPLLLDKIESQIRVKVSKKVASDLKSFSKDSDELDLTILNIYLKFPVAKRKWLETVNYFKNVKQVVNLPKSFIPNKDQHRVGTLEALEHLVTSGPKPIIKSDRMFSTEEWDEILARRVVLDHLYFDSYTYNRVPTDQIPLFIAQWLKIGRFRNEDIKLVQDAIVKGLSDANFLQNLSAVLGESSLEELFTHLIDIHDSWGHGYNWFEKNLLPLLDAPQLVMFYNRLKDEYVVDLINHTKQDTLYQHFISLVKSEANPALLKKFILSAVKAYDYEHLIEKSEMRERKIILSHLPLWQILSSKKYFSHNDIYEETHRRLEELTLEEIAYFRDLFSEEDLENKVNQVLKEININENDPDSFREAFKILERARSLTPNICILEPEYFKNLYGDLVFKKINYTRQDAFIKPSQDYIRDLIALDAFYIALTFIESSHSIVSTLNSIMKMSYQEHETDQGGLLGKGLAHIISNNDISLALNALFKTPFAAQAFILGLLKKNDQTQIQIAFRTLIFSSFREEEKAEGLLNQCLGFIDTKEKLEWIIAVWPEDDLKRESTLLNSIPAETFSKEDILAAMKESQKWSLPSIDYRESKETINQLAEKLREVHKSKPDHNTYLKFSVDMSLKLRKLKEELMETFRQDIMNPNFQKLLDQIQDLSESNNAYFNEIKLPFYTKKFESVKKKLTSLQEMENKDFATLFPILKICKRKIQRIPEFSQHPKIKEIIENAIPLERKIDTLFIESCDNFIKNAQTVMRGIQSELESSKSIKEVLLQKAYRQLSEIDSTAENGQEYLQYFSSESYKKMTLDLKILRDQIYHFDQNLRKRFKEDYKPLPKTENGWLSAYLENEKYQLDSIKENAEGNKTLLNFVVQLEGLLERDSLNQMAPLFGFVKFPETHEEFNRAIVKTASRCHPDRHPDFTNAATPLFGLINGIGKRISADLYGVTNILGTDSSWRKN